MTESPANRRLDEIEATNLRTLERVKTFREDYAAAESTFADFAKLKQQFPHFGVVPCRAAGLDFVMLHANDDVIAWQYLWFGEDGYEAQIVRRWVDWCKTPGIVLDIGGHSGLMSILAARAHPQNKVHLFEPMSRTIERASLNLKLNGVARRVHLHPFAASDTVGEAIINLYRDENFPGTGNSIHAKDNVPVIATSTVRTITIDTHLPDIAAGIVKIDVEGHELACLNGMRALLERTRPRIVIEVWDHTRDEVLGLLRGFGYALERVEDRDLAVNNYFGACE